MNNREECAEYFRSRDEWKRFFEMFRKKWESLGKTGGKITLKDSTAKERLALEKIMGKVYYEPEVTISLADFEEMLQLTRFAPITLHELLEAYFGCEIRSKQYRMKEMEEKKENFFKNCKAYFEKKEEPATKYVLDWISNMEKRQNGGYTLLNRELKIKEETAWELLCNTGNALVKALQNTEDIPIAVFAAQISGNPHYLDRGRIAGNLFIQGLCFAQGRDYPQSSAEWKECLLGAHILPDDISSRVTTLGIHLQIGEQVHPGIEAFCSMREPLVLTALNLKGVVSAWTEKKRVYIVENEMVFTYLADKIKESKIALMCTSGQLRTVAFDLIGLLVKNDIEIYYSGDMDPEGMDISDRLWQRFPEKIHIWRMSRQDYHKAISNEKIDERGFAMLNSLKNQKLQDTAKEIMKKKKAAYQENILEELCRDIL